MFQKSFTYVPEGGVPDIRNAKERTKPIIIRKHDPPKKQLDLVDQRLEAAYFAEKKVEMDILEAENNRIKEEQDDGQQDPTADVVSRIKIQRGRGSGTRPQS